jgi:acid phosphatase family membrane protein YuiD
VDMGRIWEVGGLAAWRATAVAVVVVVVVVMAAVGVRWELGVQVCERLALLLELRPSVHGAHHCVRQVEHDQLSTPLS